MKEISKKGNKKTLDLNKSAKNWAYEERYGGSLVVWDSKTRLTVGNFLQHRMIWLGAASIAIGILLIVFGVPYLSILFGTLLGFSIIQILRENSKSKRTSNSMIAYQDTWIADAIKRGHRSILLDGLMEAWSKSGKSGHKYYWSDSTKSDLIETWELSEKIGEPLETEVKTMLMKNVTPPQSKEVGENTLAKLNTLKKTLKETVAAKAIIMEDQEKAKAESSLLDLENLIEKVEVEKEVFMELADERNVAKN